MSAAELHKLGMMVNETTFHTGTGQEVTVGLHTVERKPRTDQLEVIVEIDGEVVSLPATSALLLSKAIEMMVGRAVGFSVR